MEIKTAFRRLAKLYHPDKNPEEQERFALILKAYETLSDPMLKPAYDYRLNYHLLETQRPVQKKATTKTWSFDEKELKRRNYYNEHYKKNNKTTSQYTEEVETKKTYNEYKYILFATPIAVVLFLLIMKMAMPEQPQLPKEKTQPIVETTKDSLRSQLNMGDMPYATFFGGSKYDTTYKKQLIVKNTATCDVIVCLFTKTSFIRSFYIQQNYFARVSQLPDEPFFIRYCSGLYFKYSAQLKETDVSGAFTKDLHFFKSKQALKTDLTDSIALQTLPGRHFTEITEPEFFKKQTSL